MSYAEYLSSLPKSPEGSGGMLGNSNADTTAMNSGFDEQDTKWGRVARTGLKSWERGGDLLDWVYDDENSYYGKNFDRLYEVYGGLNEYGQAPVMNPMIDTIWHDQQDIINMYKSEGFNPFYSPHHQTQQHRDRLRQLGIDRHSLESFDNKVEGNVMDYLYAKTKNADRDTIAKRGEVMKKWEEYTDGADWGSLYNKRMDEDTYKQMGLQNILGEYDADFNAQFKEGAQTPTLPMPTPTPEPGIPEQEAPMDPRKAAYLGMLTGYNPSAGGASQSIGNPIRNPISNPISNPVNTRATGSFMSAYKAKRDELASKPSVMSLFKEMENYE